jgi:hypothetical protein
MGNQFKAWDTFQIAQKKLAQAEGRKQVIEANFCFSEKISKETPKGLSLMGTQK